MSGVAVVTDTTQYLPREVVDRHGLSLVSLYVNWDGRTDRESDMPTYDAFYDYLRTSDGDLPSTSQPSVGDFLAVYEPLVERGDDIVSIHLSGGISGTVRSAEQARDALVERGVDAGADRRARLRDGRRGPRADGDRRRQRRQGRRGRAGGRRRGGGARRADDDPVRGRHARVPAPRRPDRRRPGVPRLGAEDQADPLDRQRDHARRARAHAGPRDRAARARAAGAARRGLRRVLHPARAGAGAGRAGRRARPRDLRPRPGVRLRDRPGHRHPHRPGPRRRDRASRQPCSAPSRAGLRARGANPPG